MNSQYDSVTTSPSAVSVPSTGIYTASKAKHFQMWRDYRAEGLPINSTWIDEGEVGATGDFVDLWKWCISEASSAAAVVLYAEDGEVLKGALVEIGAAMALGKPVYAVGNVEGTFHNHPLFFHCDSLEDAFECAVACQPVESIETAQSSIHPASEPNQKVSS